MRVNSYTIVHYGKSYLGYALRSIYPCVQRSFVFFTPHPSHGHKVEVPPIESRQDLQESLPIQILSKVTWQDVDQFWMEGQQRDYALAVASGDADLIVVCDYDEVWRADVLQAALEHVWRENRARNWLLNFTHLWRSFNWCCRDQAWPVRIIDTRHPGGLAYLPKELGETYHFGYAVTNEVMSYKWQCHGHKDELRPGWFENKWLQWPPPVLDCHPANAEGWWNTEPFDRQLLPDVMHSHPWFDKEIIE